MALRVVADTNVLVSIFNFGGRITEILELAVDGWIELYTSPSLLDELRGVLRSKFGWSSRRLQQLEGVLLRFCRLVRPAAEIQVAADPDDDRVLECALEASAVFIITGDRHLLRIGNFHGIEIVTPGRFLKLAPWRGRYSDHGAE